MLDLFYSIPVPFKRMGIGIALALLGLVLTGGGYLFAASSPGGGRYFIFWGLVLWGGLRFFDGLRLLPGYFQARNSPNPWVIAAYDLKLLDRLIGQGLAADTLTARQQMAASLGTIAENYPHAQISPHFIGAFASPYEQVYVAAYQSLYDFSCRNPEPGRKLVAEIGSVLKKQPQLAAQMPGGSGMVAQFEMISATQQAFEYWRATGELPELEHARGSQPLNVNVTFNEVMRGRRPGDPVNSAIEDEDDSDDDEWAESLDNDDSSGASFDRGDPGQYPVLPPLETYDAKHVQNHRMFIKNDLAEYQRAYAAGELRDESTREEWIEQHTYLDHFLEWYRSPQGERARWASREDMDFVIEYYLVSEHTNG